MMSSERAFQKVVWKHVETKGLYYITEFMIREHDLCPLVAYTGYDRETPVFVREATQFFDGRFRIEVEPDPEEQDDIDLDGDPWSHVLDAHDRQVRVGNVVIFESDITAEPKAYVVENTLPQNKAQLAGVVEPVYGSKLRLVVADPANLPKYYRLVHEITDKGYDGP
jgi:hypothetical protein